MNTREQLIDIESELGESGTLHLSENTAAQWRKVVKQLIAERPYEPGEEIEIKLREEDEWSSARFACVDPSDTNYILYYRYRYGAFLSCRCRFHRRPPKTYRVTVPEEVIDKARQITASRIDGVVAANEVCNWLANPDNWEADDES